MSRWVMAALLLTMGGCLDSKQQPFDQKVWKQSATIAGADNPRQFMVGSLLYDKVYPGQSMAGVQKLLGSPYRAFPQPGFHRVWSYPAGAKNLLVAFDRNNRVTKVWVSG